jgi:SAM-dependent methyltransferase
MDCNRVERLYEHRTSRKWRERLYRFVSPPRPFILNPRESQNFPLGRWNLYLGGAGSVVDGYINIDLFPLPGVTVVADAHDMPFRDGMFQRVECDAVLEHVKQPQQVMAEIRRVLMPGGYAHVVTPFCHPFHEYPRDYYRFTLDGLREIAGDLTVVEEGWRTGPTATTLVFLLEYVKLWLNWRAWRIIVHVGLGWILFPFRYLDLWFFRKSDAGKLGNHCYIWLRKEAC